ncbi:MAG: alpha/beta fold hydrolase [Bacteroidota bacterium]
MPLVQSPSYQPHFIFKYHHFSTIYPALFRNVQGLNFQRERITTPDQDFLDLDWSRRGGTRLLIALHGLEGSSESRYMQGIAKAFNSMNWDAVAMNFRGCSGEHNLQKKVYHSGATDDLDFVINTILQKYTYEEIVIVGYSLGGNLVLKYAGDSRENLNPKIKKIIGVSVPTDLEGSSMEIQKWKNFIYHNRFLKSLKAKFKDRQHLYPELRAKRIFNAKTFEEFDDAFTAPVHGFESARDYWRKCSCNQVLDNIAVPTLIINAKDDSFLSESSYPIDIARDHQYVHLMIPKYGGHVGFPQTHPQGLYWTEERILDFVLGKKR